MKSFVVILFSLSILSGCATARRTEALGNPVTVASAQEERGRQIFMDHCHQCHTGGQGAVGPSINDKLLPGFLIHLQVRAGLGAMPGFSEKQISDNELDDLIAYLKAARRTPLPTKAAGG